MAIWQVFAIHKNSAYLNAGRQTLHTAYRLVDVIVPASLVRMKAIIDYLL
jgi:hypothetical protein